MKSLMKFEHINAASLDDAVSIIRQYGSHIVLKKSDPFAQIVVPDHKELDTGTLRAIIRQSGLSVDEFLKFV